MNKYNERVLKNVLEDIREENDIKLQQDAEDAAANPLFANNDETDKRFHEALKEIDKNKNRKKQHKTFLRVASVFLAVLVGLTAVTLSVDAFREKLWEIISNIGNPSYSSMVVSDNPNDVLLSEYEGMYIPKYIPEGYSILSVYNSDTFYTIDYKSKSGKTISYTEYTQDIDKKFNLDKEDFDSYEVHQDNNRETVIATKNGVIQLIIRENGLIFQVSSNDNSIDFLSFAEMIEKK